MCKEIWVHRSQISAIFLNQWQSLSTGTGLGAFWNYVVPIVPIGTYVLLSTFKILPQFGDLDPIVAISYGVTVWFLLTGAMQVPISTVASKRTEALKTSFPLVCSITASFGQLVFDTLVRFAFCLVAVVFLQVPLSPNSALVPLLLLPGLLLASSLGLLLSILNAIYADVSRLVAIAVQYGMFLSGVIFPIKNIPLLESINTFNPFYYFIKSTRELALTGKLDTTPSLWGWTLVALLVSPFLIRTFYVMEERIRD